MSWPNTMCVLVQTTIKMVYDWRGVNMHFLPSTLLTEMQFWPAHIFGRQYVFWPNTIWPLPYFGKTQIWSMSSLGQRQPTMWNMTDVAVPAVASDGLAPIVPATAAYSQTAGATNASLGSALVTLLPTLRRITDWDSIVDFVFPGNGFWSLMTT